MISLLKTQFVNMHVIRKIKLAADLRIHHQRVSRLLTSPETKQAQKRALKPTVTCVFPGQSPIFQFLKKMLDV